ncbi:dihydrofolate reductase family protein [Kribbella sp. NPDC051586]|uniref:dihydrofolate reductase family protein n=1 Tax=Kribbella sp. NPDC051586 TaxID=3364118 RepID=UPI0037A972A1
MAKLIYSAITSLDGYVEDAEGGFAWAAPDAEVHAFVNELERPIGTYLYGRRMYDTMVYWETAVDHSPVSQDYANIWQSADKIVYSRTLDAVTSARTRLEREFTAESVQQLKNSSAADLSIGGADLGGQALLAGLVDEIHLVLNPVTVGGGKPALPSGLQTQLTLTDEHHFTSGVVNLHYTVQNP